MGLGVSFLCDLVRPIVRRLTRGLARLAISALNALASRPRPDPVMHVTVVRGTCIRRWWVSGQLCVSVEL